MLNKLIHYFLANKLVSTLLLLLLVGWGLVTAPLGWEIGALPNDPMAVNDIPASGLGKDLEQDRLRRHVRTYFGYRTDPIPACERSNTFPI